MVIKNGIIMNYRKIILLDTIIMQLKVFKAHLCLLVLLVDQTILSLNQSMIPNTKIQFSVKLKRVLTIRINSMALRTV